MELVFKHFWIACIAVVFANAAVWWSRSREHRERDPSLTDQYRSVLRGFVVWGNIPWLIMGLGIVVGGVPSVFAFLDPRSSNPYVIGWFGSLLLLWALGTYWLFLCNGAEQLSRLPGILQPPFDTPTGIKTLWFLCVLAGLVAVAGWWFGGLSPGR